MRNYLETICINDGAVGVIRTSSKNKLIRVNGSWAANVLIITALLIEIKVREGIFGEGCLKGNEEVV